MLLARSALALVFGLAGALKLLDLKRSRTALSEFGVPAWLADPAGIALPLIELCAACLLLPISTVWWGALASVVLLSAFVVGIAVNLARGKRPDCNCFGQLYSEPIGPSTLVRNGLLLLFATGVLVRSSHSAGLSLAVLFEMNKRDALVAVCGAALAFAVIVEGWLIIHTLRQNGRLLLRIEALEASGAKPQTQAQPGLPVGSPGPPFELTNARGGTGSLASLRELGKSVLLVFSDANCGPCKAMRPDLERWERDHSDKLTIAVITRGEAGDKISRQGDLKFVYLQKDREVAAQYQAFGTPSAVLITKDGSVASPLASGAAAIGALISAAASGYLPAAPAPQRKPQPVPEGPPIGTPAPTLTMPDLSGKPVHLAAYRGKKTMLLFWNPSCGFCARMLPDLKNWEKTGDGTEPRLVLISAGTPEQNRAMELRSDILLDQDASAVRLFGARGTPSALLLDERGNIASAVAVGEGAVFALAGATEYREGVLAPVLSVK